MRTWIDGDRLNMALSVPDWVGWVAVLSVIAAAVVYVAWDIRCRRRRYGR